MKPSGWGRGGWWLFALIMAAGFGSLLFDIAFLGYSLPLLFLVICPVVILVLALITSTSYEVISTFLELQRIGRRILWILCLPLVFVSAGIKILVFVGGLLVMGGIGEVINSPYDVCRLIPPEEVTIAVREGFLLNQKCCVDSMIGACAIVTEKNRTVTPLRFAVQVGELSHIQALERVGANMQEPGLIVDAVRERGREILSYFIAKGAPLEEIRAGLDVAVRRGLADEAMLLISTLRERGVVIPPTEIEGMVRHGIASGGEHWISEMRRLADAESFTHSFTLSLLCRDLRRLSFDKSSLLRSRSALRDGFTGNELCEDGSPLWFIATSEGDVFFEEVEAMRKRGADIFATDKNGKMWFHRLSMNNQDGSKSRLWSSLNEEIQLRAIDARKSADAIPENLPVYIDGKRVR